MSRIIVVCPTRPEYMVTSERVDEAGVKRRETKPVGVGSAGIYFAPGRHEFHETAPGRFTLTLGPDSKIEIDQAKVAAMQAEIARGESLLMVEVIHDDKTGRNAAERK